jgi:hypothetical protein
VEHKGSLPYPQKPATGPYPEPDKFNPHLKSCFLNILILNSHLLRGLPSDMKTEYVHEICALLGYYAASCGNCLPTFRDNVSDSWPVKMGPIRCPKTSVNNYHTTPRNNPEERRSHQHRSGSLKSRICAVYSYGIYIHAGTSLFHICMWPHTARHFLSPNLWKENKLSITKKKKKLTGTGRRNVLPNQTNEVPPPIPPLLFAFT